MAAGCVIGVDLGGTKLLAGTVDSRLDVHHRAYRLHRPGDAAAVIDQLVEAIQESIDTATSEVLAVGVGVPALVDPKTGVALDSNHLPLHGVNVRDLLAERLDLPVVVDNDATAAAIGDFWSGVLGTVHAHATIYMGLGIGAGVVINGTVFRGASSNAGEIGQVPIATAADGSLVTIEELADPWAVVNAALLSPLDSNRLKLGDADDFTAFRIITKAALRGDAFATGLLERSARHLATGATVLANLFDLDSITLAGPAFAVAGSLYVRILEQRVNAAFFARAKHSVRVRLSAHASDAAAVGAAALVLQTELAPRTMGLTALEE